MQPAEFAVAGDGFPHRFQSWEEVGIENWEPCVWAVLNPVYQPNLDLLGPFSILYHANCSWYKTIYSLRTNGKRAPSKCGISGLPE